MSISGYKKIDDPKTLRGVIVIVQDSENRILLGERRYTVAAGSWGTPGGRYEINESELECAMRETKEETGLDVYDPEIFGGEFKLSAYGYNFEFMGIVAKKYSGTPIVIPNENHSRWDWFSLDELPTPLFVPAGYAIQYYKEKKERQFTKSIQV